MVELGDLCLIWGTSARIDQDPSGAIYVVSDRAGGAYRMSPEAAQISKRLEPKLRSLLTTWLVDQRGMGDPAPLVNLSVLERIKNARALKFSERIDRFFLALSSVNYSPGQPIKLYGVADNAFKKWYNLLCAWTEVEAANGNFDLTPLLMDDGYLVNPPLPRLTAKGFDRLERLAAGRTQFDQGFVAMWFGAEMNSTYDEGFARAIEDAGYKPTRIDRKEHNNKIDDEIIAEIRRSRFLVADMTCPVFQAEDGQKVPIPRGGVYYEAGFAQGLGMPVIWCTRQGTIDHVHFDTRQYNHIIWVDAADLRAKLKVRIGAVLGYGPLSPTK